MGHADAEADWEVSFPKTTPLINPKKVYSEDGWYKGEDCVDPSGVVPVSKWPILPDPDGSLSLRGDAMLPNAPQGCTK